MTHTATGTTKTARVSWALVESSLFALHLLVVRFLETLPELRGKLVVARLADRLQVQLKELRPNHTFTHIRRTDHTKTMYVKSFQSRKAHRAALVSISSALNQIPVYTARPQIWSYRWYSLRPPMEGWPG